MYEMEGALLGPRRTGSASGLAEQRPRAHRSGQVPARNTGFPVLPASRSYPRMVPVSNGESISTASVSVAQEPTGIHFRFFLRPHVVHKTRMVIRTSQRLSTGFCTAHPQATGDKPEVTGYVHLGGYDGAWQLAAGYQVESALR
jgi:hypothetical protein